MTNGNLDTDDSIRTMNQQRTCIELIGVLILALSLVGIFGQACSSDTSESTSPIAPGLDVLPLVDTNPDPDVVEVQLVASEGTTRYLPDGDAKIWGYHDGAVPSSKASVPGPRLEASQGQTVIVHFKNELPESTTIHWHGLRVPNGSDGTPSVQAEVQPGGTFEYRFVARDAGTFWYHPHVRSDVQIERGLYGAIVVHGGVQIAVDADRTFVIDDVKLNATGELSEDTTQLDVMLGRQGNVLLANGVRAGQIVVRSGARERWRFVNSANGRYFNLHLPGQQLRVIGWDGGLIAEPYEVDALLIAPGERYEVLVDFPQPSGTDLTLQTLHYDRGHNVPDPGPLPVFNIAVHGTVATPEPLPDTWGDSLDLTSPANATERRIELTEEEQSGQQFPKFFINGEAFPAATPIKARAGDIEVWRIYNNSEMDHPFHLHGHFFRVLDADGGPPMHDGWKDTVNVPQKQVLRFVVRYGDVGTWMFHCHILEHAERGMMSELTLTP